MAANPQTMIPFGNDPAKIAGYQAFWTRASVKRPLIGFFRSGWFPLQEFRAVEAWSSSDCVTADMIAPEAFLDDHLRMLREGEEIDDDVIRGACPGHAAIPWLQGAAGCTLRILPGNIMGEERNLPWEEALRIQLDPDGPWFRKYLEFADALARLSADRFPVSHSPEVGPTDIHALLRGHTQSLLDLHDEPEKSAELLRRAATLFHEATTRLWERLPLFHGGYFDAQYSLWSPGPIIRMQEDATAVYSPALYRTFVQPVDRYLASQYESSFIHLHSTSMFLLDAILEIEEIRCCEINQDALGPPVARMIPHFRKVQDAGRPLLIRGSFTPDELRMLTDSLESRGLFLYIMVRDLSEMEQLRPIAGM